MTLQRCAIVLGFLVCYSLSSMQTNADRIVNCQLQIYHPKCRGSQTKRSSLQTDETSYRNVQRLEDLFGITDSTRKSSHLSRSHNGVGNNYEKSRLWTALLDRGLNPDAMYDWYLAYLEKTDANRQKWMEENYPTKNLQAEEDY